VVPPSKHGTHTAKQATQTPKQATRTSKQATQTPKQAAQIPKQATQTPKQAAQIPKQATQTPKQAAQIPKQAAQISQARRPGPPSRQPSLAPPTQKKAFASMLQHGRMIQSSKFGEQPAVASRLKEIGGLTDNLQQILAGRKVPSIYSEALSYDERKLENVARAVSGNNALGADEQARLVESLEYVRSDLSTKASYAKENPSNPSGTVNVKVITRNSDNMEVGGYKVWYSLIGWYIDKDEDHYHLFDSLSSPTDQPLSAGNYMFWTAKGAQLGPPEPYTIGGPVDTRQARSIDLPTP
jgi:hypothetical protein